jgi:AcrR family transcriptional regulator
MTMDGDMTRARLISEARDLYLEQGLPRFSLREVARRAGVTAAAIYRHYDGKEALLREVAGEGFRVFSAYLLRALSANGARERMAASAEQYLRFGLEHPRDYRFIFMSTAEDVAEVTPHKPREGRAPTFQFLVDRVCECIQARVLRKADPDELATVIWAHVHGLVSLRLSGHLARTGSDARFKSFYTESCAQLLAGLAP